jgi:pyruvate dehydrogenase E1 component alpha subunit
MVEGMGIIAVKIETRNAFECLKSTTEAINLARSTKKPVFIEYDTYRWLEHCGPNQDDHLGYRPQSEISKWKEQDPLLNLKEILISDFGISNAALELIQQEIANEVLAAFLQAKKDEFPTLDQSMSDVYAQ